MKRASWRRFLRKAGLQLGGAVSWARQPIVPTSSPVTSTPPRDATWIVVPLSRYVPASVRDALALLEQGADMVLTVDPPALIAGSVVTRGEVIQMVDADDAISTLAGEVTRIMAPACESVTPGWGSTGLVQRRSAGLTARGRHAPPNGEPRAKQGVD